jgi:hypothetical protein
LQRSGKGWKHAVNDVTRARSCGQIPQVTRIDADPLAPGTVLEMWHPAGTISINHHPFKQRFHEGACGYLLNTAQPIRRSGEIVAWATVTGVEVAKDGSGVLIKMKVLEPSEEAA